MGLGLLNPHADILFKYYSRETTWPNDTKDATEDLRFQNFLKKQTSIQLFTGTTSYTKLVLGIKRVVFSLCKRCAWHVIQRSRAVLAHAFSEVEITFHMGNCTNVCGIYPVAAGAYVHMHKRSFHFFPLPTLRHRGGLTGPCILLWFLKCL